MTIVESFTPSDIANRLSSTLELLENKILSIEEVKDELAYLVELLNEVE